MSELPSIARLPALWWKVHIKFNLDILQQQLRMSQAMQYPLETETKYEEVTVSADKESSTRAIGNPVLCRVLDELDRLKDQYGGDHNSVAEAWNALGLVKVHMQRDTTGAMVCHEEACRIYIRNGEKVETAFTLSDLAYCYEQLGMQSKALSLYQDVLCIISEEKISEFHPKLGSTQRAIARIQRR